MERSWGELSSPWVCGNPKGWEGLFDDAHTSIVSRNELLYRQGDRVGRVYCVMRGRLRIFSTLPGGGEKQLYIAEEGSVCGEEECLAGVPMATSALAILETEVAAISREAFLSAVDGRPELVRRLLDYEVRKSFLYRHQVLALSSTSAEGRVAQALLNLAWVHGVRGPRGCRLRIRFTKGEMAGIVGASRVTVSNVFSELEREGVVESVEGHYVIRDLDRLRSLAGLTEEGGRERV